MEFLKRISNYLESLYEKPHWYEYIPPLSPVYFHRQKDVFSAIRSKLIDGRKEEEALDLKRRYYDSTKPGLVITSSLLFMSAGFGILSNYVSANYTKWALLSILSSFLSWNYSELHWGLNISKLIKNLGLQYTNDEAPNA